MEPQVTCNDMLEYIFAYYNTMFNYGDADLVRLYKTVAVNISASSLRSWSWRYVMSVRNETMKPGQPLIDAIKIHYNRIKSKPWKPRNRIAVNLDDPISAAKSIKGRQPGAEYIAKLIKELRR